MLRFVIVFLIAVLASMPAAAQTICGQRADVLSGLNGTYTETPTAMGLSNNGGVVEILTSPKGDTWTIIIILPNGMSYLVAAGENWEKMPHKAAFKGA